MGFPTMVDDKLALIVGISNWNVGWELLKEAMVERGDDKLALIVGISNWNVGWELLKGVIVENWLRYLRFFLILVLLDLSSP